MIGLSQAGEYSEFYADYVRRAPEEDVVHALELQLSETLSVFRRVSEERSQEHPDGKWSVREVMGHLCDTERVFAYRAWRFSRGDQKELQGFEQDDYIRDWNYNDRTLADLTEEFAALRRATIAQFRRITPEAAARRGKANGKEVSVRALLHITLGHERRHVELIRERYGV